MNIITTSQVVITSNFEKLRFYIDNAVDFEEFNLFHLTKERFEILWLCLSSEYLLKDIPKKIKDESLTQEENVTKKLYKDYASFRNDIFAYNGGLFATDETLDNIKINDDLLYNHTINLSNYDFESEVSVNIFEHSLNDIEEIQNDIEGISNDQSKSKRKKDGVFYTPISLNKELI